MNLFYHKYNYMFDTTLQLFTMILYHFRNVCDQSALPYIYLTCFKLLKDRCQLFDSIKR